jgi:hydrogenase maturation factor
LVHVGFAMSRLDEAEAARTLALLRALGEAQAELTAIAQTETEVLDERVFAPRSKPHSPI